MIYDILILGAGWTSTFLIPLLEESKKKYAATSTTGRDHTIKFKFDPDATSADAYKALPEADTILITFPLQGKGQSKRLLEHYGATHTSKPRYIQFGSTGIWQTVTSPKRPDLWITRASPYDTENARAIAEDELKGMGGVILNLSGLWGGSRQPRTFVDRLFKEKRDVKEKKSLHMIHGRDVARAVLAVMEDWPGPSRWMLTDGFVYDWWSLIAGWGSSSSSSSGGAAATGGVSESRKDAEGNVVKWVFECMAEEQVRALPRSMESLGRCYDSREFWETFHLVPVRARI